jgi:hypothetical protein
MVADAVPLWLLLSRLGFDPGYVAHIIDLDREADAVKYECMVGSPGFFLLNQACLAVRYAFGSVFLVGSAIASKDYRDVDVRAILADREFERLFPGLIGNPRLNPMWSLLCSSISVHLSQASGLPVDFQIQAQTVANEKHPGQRRIPLGLYPQIREEDRRVRC